MGLFGDKKDAPGAAVADPQTQNLEALKNKYQSVLNFIKQSGTKLENVHLENGKLLIRGEAPTELVKNQIWDQVKLANPGWSSELVADIKVVPGQGGPQGGSLPPTRSYTVKSGDTLSKISKAHYGDAGQYMKIFEANRGLLKDPDKIQPGQVLTIPD